MVYFPDSATPVTADVTTVAAVWTARIDSDDRELPGLRGTLAPAARRWGSPAPQGLALLGPLVERGRLVDRAARGVA